MRTNIVIDDALMKEALAVSENPTKKGTVEEALRLLVKIKHQSAVRDFRGKLHWEGDLNAMRIDR